MTTMWERAHAIQDELVVLRRAIHRRPELGFQEFETSNLAAGTMRSLGARVRTGVGTTGVVADLGAAGAGRPCIAIRADMDALPVWELNPVAYCSTVPGVMHACGHDAHVAMALGAAKLLAEEELPGQVRFLFQPSEERPDEQGVSGAAHMIRAGALDGVDLVIAQHIGSETETGLVRIVPGPMSATEETFWITIRGKGCHGAYPHTGRDPIFISGQVIGAIHGIISRQVNPMRSAVISIGLIQGGTQVNIIPSEVRLAGTIRSFDQEVRATLHAELRRAAEVARALGGDYELKIDLDAIATVNDPRVCALIRGVARDLLGDDKVLAGQPDMGAEDFGFMTQAVPGAMYSLGTKKGEPRVVHGPTFDIDEAALPIGTAILAETVRRYLHAGCLPGPEE
jgi:amidohydrolase